MLNSFPWYTTAEQLQRQTMLMQRDVCAHKDQVVSVIVPPFITTSIEGLCLHVYI